MTRRLRITVLSLLLCSLLLAGCATATPAQKGAMGGAVVGGLAGQMIGGNTSSTLIGAGVGALGGALLNDHLANK